MGWKHYFVGSLMTQDGLVTSQNRFYSEEKTLSRNIGATFQDTCWGFDTNGYSKWTMSLSVGGHVTIPLIDHAPWLLGHSNIPLVDWFAPHDFDLGVLGWNPAWALVVRLVKCLVPIAVQRNNGRAETVRKLGKLQSRLSDYFCQVYWFQIWANYYEKLGERYSKC